MSTALEGQRLCMVDVNMEKKKKGTYSELVKTLKFAHFSVAGRSPFLAEWRGDFEGHLGGMPN